MADKVEIKARLESRKDVLKKCRAKYLSFVIQEEKGES